jgi:pyrroline-5-carboxylate reductase
MKIAFIGGGNMGEAMLAAVLDKKLSTPEDICVGEVDEVRRQQLQSQYGVAVMESNRDAVPGKDVVVFAVKPQNLSGVLTDLNGRLESSQLVLSIVAGVRTDTLCQGLGHDCVVRAMPNTPARAGFGMSAWIATTAVTGGLKGLAKAILGAMGKEIFFDDEKYLDMATAVSGSGPAYFFLLAESLIEAAVQIGIPQDEAQALVSQTMLGSAHLMQESGETPTVLRQKVTSRGGTTERALQVFEDGGFTDLVKKAVRAAYERAKELGS